MKILNLIVPIMALTSITNTNNQVQAAWVEREMPVNYSAYTDACKNAHEGAQLLCTFILEPVMQTTCRLSAAAALMGCMAACQASGA